ncbi:ABC transporter ATP-binding protein/permease [Aldersonia sp. NBC_00410]|uniref:ABC transporter ATP-binding protein n=1 Tax=Aldersonia sp. NBC_00410 TaxID=2975954 RepID=UPI00225BD74D|nr:ABC transporter ATP-binding protein [Aldersonia sp. NBC_00410]MCX5044168.1 ABC transporter ATP-binding protein/permease [Aldersonia sp. NBC_00410]
MNRVVARLRTATLSLRTGFSYTPGLFTGVWLTALLAIAGAGGRIVVPLTIQYALDHTLLHPTASEDGHVLPVAITIGAVAVTVAGVSSLLLNRRLVRTAETALAQLRERAFAHVFALAPGTLDDRRRGSLVSRVTSDVDTVSQFTQAGGVTLVSNLAQMFMAAAVMLVYSWPLALLVIGVSVLAVIAMRLTQRVIARRFGDVRIAVAALYDGISEMLHGVEVARSYGMTDLVHARVDNLIIGTEQKLLRAQRPLAVNMSLGEAASGVITTTVVLFGAAAGAGHIGWLDLTAGRLVAFLFLITFFVRPLQFSVSILGDSQSAVAGLRRVLALLAEPSAAVPDHAGVALPEGGISLRLRGVEFGYTPDTRALQRIDLTIAPHEHVAVVGETGSGKSTFAKLITRQLVPTCGEIELAGVDARRITDSSLSRRIAIVPQEAFLFDRSVLDNIALGRPGATRRDVLEVLGDLGLREWVDGLPEGLDTAAGIRGEALSAGERQLVALARTALIDPDLLVLDEATSGVDPATDVRVQQALARLTKGRTTVTIAHRMITAETADTVALFHGGRLIEHGPHDELVAHGGRYAALYGEWAAMNSL